MKSGAKSRLLRTRACTPSRRARAAAVAASTAGALLRKGVRERITIRGTVGGPSRRTCPTAGHCSVLLAVLALPALAAAQAAPSTPVLVGLTIDTSGSIPPADLAR